MSNKNEKLEILRQLDEYKTFGTQLAEGMKIKGYSKQALSEELISRNHYIVEKTIARWQRDLEYPDITIIYLLAEILDLNVNNLLIAKQLMQKYGLASINMELMKKVCKFFDKSLVFAYYFIKIGIWVGLIFALGLALGIEMNIFLAIGLLIGLAIIVGIAIHISLG